MREAHHLHGPPSLPTMLIVVAAGLTWAALPFAGHPWFALAIAPGFLMLGAGIGIGMDRLWRRLDR